MLRLYNFMREMFADAVRPSLHAAVENRLKKMEDQELSALLESVDSLRARIRNEILKRSGEL